MTAEQIDTSRSETIPEPAVASANYKPYDGSNLSYAGTFTNPFKANAIRVIEWLTGKITLLRLVRRFERTGRQAGQTFWGKALSLLDIDLLTPDDQIARIPATGPLVVVAKPSARSGRRADPGRTVGTAAPGLQDSDPVAADQRSRNPVPHAAGGVSARAGRAAIEPGDAQAGDGPSAEGGAVILFPAGQVATSPGWFDAALEPDWLPFTAKMILKSQARVVPVFFPGQNSRWFQIANHLSLTLRQGLLLHEIASAMHKPQAPVIGEVIDRDAIEPWQGDPRGFMADLRAQTLALGGR
jgi:hypothetical protein